MIKCIVTSAVLSGAVAIGGFWPVVAQAQFPAIDPKAFLRIYTGEPKVTERPDPYHKFSYQHGAFDLHHGREFWYNEGRHHGFPYGCSDYETRFPGMSYSFGHWSPTRSYYYPYQSGHNGPYGYSTEPYYDPPPPNVERLNPDLLPPPR